MEDYLEFLFVGMVLYFGLRHVYIMEKFKARALERREIQRIDLQQTVWRIIKHMLLTIGTFILLFLVMYLIAEDFEIGDLYSVLLVCPFGLLFFTFFGLSGYMLTLRGTFRLPFVDDEANEANKQSH